MSNKKYFWLKLNSDFFDQTHIKYLRKLPDGDRLVIVYLKMQLKSLKNDGILYFEGVLEDYITEVAMSIDEEVNIVTLCISALQKMKLIELLEGNNVFLIETLKITGRESESAERVRQYRLNKEDKALQCNKDVTKCNGDVTKCNTEKRREREEKELDIEKRREEKEPLLEKASKTRFQIPTESDVILYLQQELSSKYQRFKKLPECESFFEKWFSYYESNGWKVGRNQMKDWKASIRQWLSKDYSASKEEKLDESSFENWTDERKRIYKILQEA